MGPPNIASNPTVPPMASPAKPFTALASTAAPMITVISRKVRMNSSTREWVGSVAGRVAPRAPTCPKVAQRTPDAAAAPANCAARYPGTRRHANSPTAAKPRVTAGLKCAPEVWPKV